MVGPLEQSRPLGHGVTNFTCTIKNSSSSERPFFGHRHISLKVPNVEFDLMSVFDMNALIGQNLMSK